MLKQMRIFISLTVLASFIGSSIQVPVYAQDFSINQLPVPGTMVSVSPTFDPALIRGLTVHQDNPFLFDFIVDPGQSKLSQAVLKDESERMIKYFFASLTIPDKDIWVNLSPYEKDRMIPMSLGQTAMGRDLLAQDYMLKQLTASLIYPQKELGKTFWAKVYAKAKEMYGTTQIPVNTFNKVWIMPQSVGIYEHGQTAYIVSGRLKVMLEADYLSLTKHNAISSTSSANVTNQSQVNQIGSQIIRAIILPEIEKEVNDGKNFATLRQVFYAEALAVWFKHNLKQALLNRVYANKGTVKGIDQNDAATNDAIYHQYLRAYKKGVFNFIQEDIDPVTQETLPRKYFSGGWEGVTADEEHPVKNFPTAAMVGVSRAQIVTVLTVNRAQDAIALDRNASKAMTVSRRTLGILAASAIGVPAGIVAINHLLENEPQSAVQLMATADPRSGLSVEKRLKVLQSLDRRFNSVPDDDARGNYFKNFNTAGLSDPISHGSRYKPEVIASARTRIRSLAGYGNKSAVELSAQIDLADAGISLGDRGFIRVDGDGPTYSLHAQSLTAPNEIPAGTLQERLKTEGSAFKVNGDSFYIGRMQPGNIIDITFDGSFFAANQAMTMNNVKSTSEWLNIDSLIRDIKFTDGFPNVGDERVREDKKFHILMSVPHQSTVVLQVQRKSDGSEVYIGSRKLAIIQEGNSEVVVDKLNRTAENKFQANFFGKEHVTCPY